MLCGSKNKLFKGVLYKWKYGKSCYCTNESTENHVLYKVFNDYTEILPTDDSGCLELWTFCRAAASCPTCPKSMRKKSSDLPDSYNLWFFVKHKYPCTVYIKMVHLNMVTNSCVQYSPIHAILFGLLSVFINAYCSNLTFTYLSWIISEQYNWESCELMDPNGLICTTMYLSRPIDSLLVLEVIFVHP